MQAVAINDGGGGQRIQPSLAPLLPFRIQGIALAAGVLTVSGIGSPSAAEQRNPPDGRHKVTLIPGGKFCDNYPEDVEIALKKVPGVKAVDLKSVPRQAVVETEPGKAKPDQLVAAVNGVKGSGWYCTAKLMK